MATLAYIVLLVVFGLRAHSLALLSEAGHNLSDFLALLLSWLAVYFQVLPPSSTKTYGYQRAGVLAAFVNALTLVGVAFYIFYAAVQRLHTPVPVHATVMIVVAAAGMLMNGVIAGLLYGSSHDVNIRSAFIHMLGDTVSTAAVIAGGWAIAATGLELDRSGAIDRDRPAHPVVVVGNHSRDVEHPARGNSARDGFGTHSEAYLRR